MTIEQEIKFLESDLSQYNQKIDDLRARIHYFENYRYLNRSEYALVGRRIGSTSKELIDLRKLIRKKYDRLCLLREMQQKQI